MKKAGEILSSYSIIFTFATIISSLLQLSKGRLTDTNFHILDRAIITGIGVSVIYLEKYCYFKIKLLNVIFPYFLSLTIVLIYTWLTGSVETLHPNAYRDITLNFSVLFIIIFVIIKLTKKDKN